MERSLKHPPFYKKNKICRLIKKGKGRDTSKEIVWTYLVARKYENKNSHVTLASKLCGSDVEEIIMPKDSKIWLEAHLQPTREKEGKSWMTCADLSMGYLEEIENRELQVRSNGKWVCICEAKWEADIDYDKTNNINQLTKVIEHALLLHNQEGTYPKRVYVTLITPQYFKDKPQGKMYQNIFPEYQKDKNLIIKHLQDCKLKFRNYVTYDFINERLSCLSLNWVTFEELLSLPNLVEEDRPGKYRVTIDSWEEILLQMGREDLFKELT